jgi:hypothetical protein
MYVDKSSRTPPGKSMLNLTTNTNCSLISVQHTQNKANERYDDELTGVHVVSVTQLHLQVFINTMIQY